MGNNSVPKFIFRLSRFPVYKGSVLGRFYCIYVQLFYLVAYVPLLYEIFVYNEPCVSDTKSDSNVVLIFLNFGIYVEYCVRNVSFLGACSQNYEND